MPKAVPVSDVKLSYDKKENVIRMSSTDPQFGGEPFVATFAPGTRSFEKAAEALRRSGAPIDPAIELPSGGELTLSQDPFQACIGRGVDAKTRCLTITTPDHNRAPSILILGDGASGAATVKSSLEAHFKAHPETFSTVDIPKEALRGQLFKQTSKYDNKDSRFQAVFVDGYETDPTSISNLGDLLRTARSLNRIVVIRSNNAFEVDRLFSLNFFASWVVMGSQDFRSRVLVRTDNLNHAKQTGSGVIVHPGRVPDENDLFRSFEF